MRRTMAAQDESPAVSETSRKRSIMDHLDIGLGRLEIRIARVVLPVS
jgi:hypothetical protein